MFCLPHCIGLSPDLHSMEQIRRIMRPTDVPDTGLLCDLLWSDPDKDVQGWGENDRGVSFTFGADVVTKFLHRHDLDLICRAHQVVEDGYEFFAKRQLVTLFSAPNYCGEFDNAGGMMSVDETLMCSFQVSLRVSLSKCVYPKTPYKLSLLLSLSVTYVTCSLGWLHTLWGRWWCEGKIVGLAGLGLSCLFLVGGWTYLVRIGIFFYFFIILRF